MLSTRKITLIGIAILLVLLGTACKKKVPAPPPPPPPKVEAPPPPPPPPPAPLIAEFVAEPGSIERGQSSTLRWRAQNANDISIDQGVGSVQASGSRPVSPRSNTTYTLTAKGPGGSATARASVNVTAPPPPPPPPPKPKPSLDERLREVQDAYYDYDKSDIREDARSTLTRNADALKAILRDFPNASVVIEGHCDERGSAEYNLGLGDRRSSAARDFLTQLGVPSSQLKTISYGKERPQCTESAEGCWQRNRRAHFSAGQ